MSVREMYLLPCGSLELDQSILTAGMGMGTIVRSPSHAALIATDEGWILVDTGLNPDGLMNPEFAWGARAKVVRPSISRDDDIRNRLQEVGVTPKDIKMVINTHLHWDHTGGNRFFPDCPVLVQKAEYRFALYPDKHISSPYMENHFKHPLNYQLIEGYLEIVAGVSVVPTPGHTAGHQSVVVKLPESGHMIIAGDAIYCNRNIEGPVPPGNCWSQPHAVDSIRKLTYLQQQFGGTFIPGHEPGLWQEFKSSPANYR